MMEKDTPDENVDNVLLIVMGFFILTISLVFLMYGIDITISGGLTEWVKHL